MSLAIANTAHDPREIPACIAKREADAEYGWFSHRHLLIAKGDAAVSLSADDLRRLFDFVQATGIEEQI